MTSANLDPHNVDHPDFLWRNPDPAPGYDVVVATRVADAVEPLDMLGLRAQVDRLGRR